MYFSFDWISFLFLGLFSFFFISFFLSLVLIYPSHIWRWCPIYFFLSFFFNVKPTKQLAKGRQPWENPYVLVAAAGKYGLRWQFDSPPSQKDQGWWWWWWWLFPFIHSVIHSMAAHEELNLERIPLFSDCNNHARTHAQHSIQRGFFLFVLQGQGQSRQYGNQH